MRIKKRFNKAFTLFMSFLMGFGVVAASPIDIKALSVYTQANMINTNDNFAMRFDLANGGQAIKTYQNRIFAGWKSQGNTYTCIDPVGNQISGTQNLQSTNLVSALNDTFARGMKNSTGKSTTRIAEDIGYLTYFLDTNHSSVSGLSAQRKEIFAQMYTWQLMGGTPNNGTVGVPPGGSLDSDGTGTVFVRGQDYYYTNPTPGYYQYPNFTVTIDGRNDSDFGNTATATYNKDTGKYHFTFDSTYYSFDAPSFVGDTYTAEGYPARYNGGPNFGDVNVSFTAKRVWVEGTPSQLVWTTTSTKYITTPDWYINAASRMDAAIANLRKTAGAGSISPAYQKDLFSNTFEYAVTPPSGMTMAQYMALSDWPSSKPGSANYDSTGNGTNDMKVWYGTNKVYIEGSATSKDNRFTINLPLTRPVVNGVKNVSELGAFIDSGGGGWSGQNLNRAMPLVAQGALKFDIELIKFGHISLNKSTNHRDHASAPGAIFRAFNTEAEAEAATSASTNYLGDKASNSGVVGSNGKAEIKDIVAVNANGSARTVYVKEVFTPEPFLADDTVYPVTLVPNEFTDANRNRPISNVAATGQIELFKLDRETGSTPQGEATLAGAVYEIELIASEHFPSDIGYKERITIGSAPGFKGISSNRLPLGTYRIKEITPAVGYNLSTNTVEVVASYANSRTPVILEDTNVLQDVIKGTIEVFKRDEDVDDLLEKAYFEVYTDYDKNGEIEDGQEPIQVIVTDSNGRAETVRLPYGHYIVREVRAPYGYVLKPSEAYHNDLFIELEGQKHTINQENEEQRGGIEIQKYNAFDNLFPWSTAEMDFSNAKYDIVAVEMRLPNRTTAPQPGDIVASLVTDENGFAKTAIDALPLGTYDLVEVRETSTTTLNPTAVRFRLEYDDQLLRFTNQHFQDSTNHENLIDKYESMQNQLKVYAGERRFDKVWPARLDASLVGATTGFRENKTMDTYEAPRFGRIEIGKFIEEWDDTHSGTAGPLDPEIGVTFEITNHLGEVVDTIVTNDEGFGTSIFLPYGRYKVEQLVTDESIDPVDDFYVDVAENRDGEVHTFHFKNVTVPYRVKLNKKDAETGVTIPVAGVTFQIYEEGSDTPLVLREWSMAHPDGYIDYDTWTTNSTGTVVFPGLIPHGTYFLQEIDAPEGYYLDPNGERIQLEVKGPYTDVTLLMKEFEIDNHPQKGLLEVNKFGQIFKGLEEAEIEQAIQDVLDKPDKVTKTEMVPVTEKELVYSDVQETEEHIEIEKVPEMIPVLDEDGEAVLDEDGEVVMEQAKNAAGELLFKETSVVTMVPVFDEDGNPVMIPAENEHGQPVYEDVPVMDADGNPVMKEVPVLDEDGKPVLVDKDKEIELILQDMLFERGFLKDAIFEVHADADIISADTITKFFDEGDLVLRFKTTDTNALLVLAGSTIFDEDLMALRTLTEDELFTQVPMQLGKYSMKEVEAPEGYLLSGDTHRFEFTPQEQSIKFDIETHDLENIKQNAKFTFKKNFEESQWFMRDDAYKSVVFGLYNKNAITFNGITIPADTLLGLSLVEKHEDGTFGGEFGTMLAGDYYLKEETTSQEYKLADDLDGIEFTYDPLGEETVEIEVGEIDNELKEVSIKVIKVDSNNKEVLEGAVFKLWAVPNDGSSPILIGEYTTDRDGQITVGNLEIGDYFLEEVKAPDGYWVDKDKDAPIIITPDTPDGGIIEHERENEQVVVKVDKVNINEDESLADATLQLIDAETGEVIDEWVSNGDIHNISGKTIVGRKYFIKEVVTPLGFITAEIVEVIQENQHITEAVVENELIPTIRTQALFANGIKEAKPEDAITVVDLVMYDDLIVGEQYEVHAELLDKETEEVIASGEVVFTPTETSGTVEVEMTINSEVLTGTEMLVVERLYRGGRLLRLHPDFKDTQVDENGVNENNLKETTTVEEYLKQVEEQTVRVPEIGTTLFDVVDMDKDAYPSEDIQLIDIVAYNTLTPGQEYTLKGELMNKATNEVLLDAQGNKVVAERTFIASETGSGEVELTFEFDGSLLAGTQVVAFERVYNGEIEVAAHTDINDEAQTVDIPSIKTSAGNAVDGKQDILPEEKQTIVDTVTYTNLIVGREYTVSGVLMDKETEAPLLVDGEEITAERTFIAETKDGSIDIEFTLDASALEGKTIVVFEDLYREEKLVAVHRDIDDIDQSIFVPKIGTTATSDQADSTKSHEVITIVDVVAYEGLIPGQEYTLEGILMNKATNAPFLVNGKEVTSTHTFTPETSSGSEEIIFEFDGLALPKVEIVVFETLIRDEVEVVVHHDIDDEAQTVSFEGRRLDVKLVKHDSEDSEILLNGALFRVSELDADGNKTGRVEYYRTGRLNINGLPGASVSVSQNADMSNATSHTLNDKGHLELKADNGVWYYQFDGQDKVYDTLVGDGMAYLYQLAYAMGYEVTEIEAPASYDIGDNPTVVIYPEADYGVNVIENYRPNTLTEVPGGFNTSDSSMIKSTPTLNLIGLITALGIAMISKKKEEQEA